MTKCQNFQNDDTNCDIACQQNNKLAHRERETMQLITRETPDFIFLAL